MLNNFIAAYLLIVLPTVCLWRSLRAKSGERATPLMRRYCVRSCEVLILLALLWIGCMQVGYTPRQIGFDFPLSYAGAWGLGFAVLLIGGLLAADKLLVHRQTPQERADSERELLDSPVPWPTTGREVLAFVLSAALITAAWEILYRGFILLLLAPACGLPLAIIASSVAYGVAHGYQDLKKLIRSILAALAFTIAYALTHSLWWLIIIHAAVPLMAVPAVLRARRNRETELANEGLERMELDQR